MIRFERFELENGLRVIVHEDESTPLVAVNLLYNVGSKDESPATTGIAHLFEHLMFGGSLNAPNFDDPIQMAGGENNAFTNHDITNYYEVLPSENIETAFWLESDRMSSLVVSEEVLNVQKKVVVEEFKETCLDQPYGDVWHHIGNMAYKVHPYSWPTIGKDIGHVERITLSDVKDFYQRFYCPSNAILAVSGNVDVATVKHLAKKWFGDIPSGRRVSRSLPREQPQVSFEKQTRLAKVPMDALYMAFHTCARLEDDFYATDLISDILCNGPSSRLYNSLLKERRLFVEIDCYITGNIDPGLLIIEGKPSRDVSLEEAEAAIWEELENLKAAAIPEEELQKWKNKVESNLVFSELNVLNKAINLAFFEMLEEPDLINREVEEYQRITTQDIYRVANQVLQKSNCSELLYSPA